MRTAKFARVQFAPDQSPEGYIQAAHHLTPQYIYQPRYIVHANRCDSLRTTFMATSDLEGFAEKYARYTGLLPVPDDHAVRFDFPLGTRLIIVEASHASSYLPGSLFPPLPAIAGVAFRCPDLNAQGSRLKKHGFAFSEAKNRLVVPAEQAGGVAVAFEE